MARIEAFPDTSSPIESKEIHVQEMGPPELDNDAALRLVVQDAGQFDSWDQTQAWRTWWREAEILYQAPRNVSAWEGSNVTRANVVRFTVAKHVNSIAPQMYNGLFFDSPPFKLRPRPGTKEYTTRAWEAVLAAVLDLMDFSSTVKRYWIACPLFGTAIVKWGWCSEQKKVKKYVRKTDSTTVSLPLGQEVKLHPKVEFKEEEETKIIERPFCDLLDHRRVFVSPSCRVGDIRSAKWVIYQDYLNYYDIENLRNDPAYTLPDEETLKSYFFKPKEPAVPPSAQLYANSTPQAAQAKSPNIEDTADPLANTLEVLERVDEQGRIITVLNRKLVIRNGMNDLGCINYNSSNWWDVVNSFWGLGLGRIIGQDQRVDTGVTNAALDLLSSKVNWTALRTKGSNAPTQPIRQRMGGIYDIDGDDARKAFYILETPNVPPEVWVTLQASQAAAESASGANELLVQGSLPAQGRTSMGRTATGAGNLASASASRLQGPLDTFVDQVYKPLLYKITELIKERMPTQQIQDILGEKKGDEFVKSLDWDEFMNARLDFEILAAGRMQAKRAMAQSLPLMFSLFGQPAVTEDLASRDKCVDWQLLVERIEEVSDWRYGSQIIRDMTPEEKQARQQQQQMNSKLQEQMTLNNQKFSQQQQLNDQENFGRAANQMLRVVAERTMQGAPTGTGTAREGFTGE